jgi:5,5'-dehydrodivanillate O-demethylase oxygenase subunit
MVLTREANDRLTQIGRGTPAGELLRRYWHPVAVAQELTDEEPTKFVRILGEDLVLFKDKTGNVGLIQDHCPHRGASMLYGRVEQRGIACAYHGWLYDTAGNCLETPAEPADSLFHLTVKATAYPVRKFVGLYWAYLGPQPAPELPRYDVWARQDGERTIEVYPRLDCNWLQSMENSVDSSHTSILHQDAGGRGAPIPNTTRGRIDDVASWDYIEVPYGIMKKRTYKDGRIDQHPLVFPNILRQGNATQIRVPIDDTHTSIYFVLFLHGPQSDVSPEDESPEVYYVRPFKSPANQSHPFTKMRMDMVLAQDHMAWETQGPIWDRTIERLATSDHGVVMYREMVDREIRNVAEGLDPKCTVRDPNHAIIDTNLDSTLAEQGQIRRNYSIV